MQITNERPEPGLEPFIDDFLQKRKTEVRELKLALAKNDFVLLESYAHNWKGFARPYGFILLEDFALRLEQSSADQNLSLSIDLINQVEEYLEIKSK